MSDKVRQIPVKRTTIADRIKLQADQIAASQAGKPKVHEQWEAARRERLIENVADRIPKLEDEIGQAIDRGETMLVLWQGEEADFSIDLSDKKAPEIHGHYDFLKEGRSCMTPILNKVLEPPEAPYARDSELNFSGLVQVFEECILRSPGFEGVPVRIEWERRNGGPHRVLLLWGGVAASTVTVSEPAARAASA